MRTFLKSVFNPGLLLSVVTILTVFFLPDFIEDGRIISAFIAMGASMLYLMYCTITANRADDYNTWRECLGDLTGDFLSYTFNLIFMFGWYIIRFYIELPVNKYQYWALMFFLLCMTGMTLYEMIITAKNCLIAMERKNPVSIRE